MNFGEREDMLKLAQSRLETIRKKHPNAMLADPHDVNVIYLLENEPQRYHTHSVAQVSPVDRKRLFASMKTSLSRIRIAMDRS